MTHDRTSRRPSSVHLGEQKETVLMWKVTSSSYLCSWESDDSRCRSRPGRPFRGNWVMYNWFSSFVPWSSLLSLRERIHVSSRRFPKKWESRFSPSIWEFAGHTSYTNALNTDRASADWTYWIAAKRLSPQILKRLFALASFEATNAGNSSGESLEREKRGSADSFASSEHTDSNQYETGFASQPIGWQWETQVCRRSSDSANAHSVLSCRFLKHRRAFQMDRPIPNSTSFSMPLEQLNRFAWRCIRYLPRGFFVFRCEQNFQNS